MKGTGGGLRTGGAHRESPGWIKPVSPAAGSLGALAAGETGAYGGSAVVGRNREAGSGTSGVRAQPRGDQPSGAVTRMSGALGEISPSAMTSTEANLSVLVMSTGVVNE